MKLISIYLICFFLLFSACTAQKETLKSEAPAAQGAVITPSFEYLKANKGSERFFVKALFVKNSGDTTLRIKGISASCLCASGTIQQSRVQPGDSAKIMLYVNLSTISAESNIIEFIIDSDAKNSPTSVRIEFLVPVIDSLEKN